MCTEDTMQITRLWRDQFPLPSAKTGGNACPLLPLEQPGPWSREMGLCMEAHSLESVNSEVLCRNLCLKLSIMAYSSVWLGFAFLFQSRYIQGLLFRTLLRLPLLPTIAVQCLKIQHFLLCPLPLCFLHAFLAVCKELLEESYCVFSFLFNQKVGLWKPKIAQNILWNWELCCTVGIGQEIFQHSCHYLQPLCYILTSSSQKWPGSDILLNI